jgi:2-oxoglutarate ferredoxin oxidoreductase subunit gamma
MSRFEVRLSGSGGQGIITAGIILGMAASIYEGKNAVQSQSYGPEARGGASKAEVIIDDEAINYPKVMNPDILVALTQEALDKYSKDLKDKGIVIIDNLMVKKVPESKYKVYSLPIVKAASEDVGKAMVANIVMLSALNTICNIVDAESLKKAVLSRIPKGTENINIKALEAGEKIVKYAK